MGPWAAATVAVTSPAGAFFAVMGFRGLIDALDGSSGRCARCGRAALLPLPTSHECRRCHQARRHATTGHVAGRLQPRH
ncbi:MAG TPA: hypothetical protein VFJ98_03905 [Mycobacteriales bacterium]|jgi:hypothetical protein|nr:hypothetical protein [Mycobacteriales bacterium]